MGFSKTDIGVYVYLFTKKWFENKSNFTSFDISKTLKPISSFMPEEYRILYSEKAVSTSLKKLVTLGFINKIPNKKKISTGGRSTKEFYQVSRIIDLKRKIDENLDGYKQAISNTLSKFEAIEEGISLKDGLSNGEENDWKR